LLDEVAFGPTFPEHHVARERAKALEVLHHQLSVPGYLAGLWLNHAVYGGHPYGRRSSTLEGLKAVTRQDVQGFHERIMAPGSSRGMLLVVGDVDPHAVAHRLARRWENGDLDGAATTDAEQVASKPLEGLGFPVPEPQIIAVDRPESEQVTFGIGHQTIPRAHPDYYALRVANQVFGGGASSRLFMTLREQRSLTYGVYSRLSAGTRGGELSAEMATALDKAEEAAEALMNEFRGICASPISAEELTMAKQYLVGAFPRRASGVGGVASLVMMARNHGFGLEQWAEHQARIAAVDLDEVHAVTQRWIRPEALSVVAVGPGELCARALAPLGRVEVKGVGAVPPCSV